jgi:flagellar motor protein MotB
MTTAVRRARWAISFADLALLLLGFFVLLQAMRQDREQAITAVSGYFGAPRAAGVALPADRLFAPEEAMLTAAGARELAAFARAHRGRMIAIRSEGMGAGARRFDAWDLAAARLGAVARGLRDAGVPASAIRIGGLSDEGPATAQTIHLEVARQ